MDRPPIARVARARRTRSGEAGFSLVEVVVAIALLLIFAGAIIGTIIESSNVSSGNRNRVTAASVATNQLEIIRSENVSAIPIGLTTTTAVEGGITYTISQTVRPQSLNSSTPLCQAAAGVSSDFKEIAISVSWPGMTTFGPVRADTLKALNQTGTSTTTGSVTVSVTDANGVGVGSVAVTLSPGLGTQTTGADGCAVFLNVPPGSSYTASLSRAGYVDPQGNPAPTANVPTVVAQNTSKLAFSYDMGGLVTLVTAPTKTVTGYAAPLGLPVTLTNTAYTNVNTNGINIRSFPDCVATATTTGCSNAGLPVGTNPTRVVAGVYPSSSGYGSYAGDCADAYPGTSGAYTVVNDPAPYGSVAVVPVSVAHTGALPIYATHAPDTSCANGDSLLIGTGPLALTALPYGKWTFSNNPSPTATTGPRTTVTITPQSTTASPTPTPTGTASPTPAPTGTATPTPTATPSPAQTVPIVVTF